ncbi:MAG: protein kinase [Chitinivibrionales bacterium]|nr:protein kinase [Chitinivibrionales bacterium]
MSTSPQTQEFKRYKILREIDSGGMATVYLATDRVLNRDVALKMVHPHLMGKPGTIRRFHNEAHAIASLSHENIIKLFDYGEENGRQYLVMEYIDGCTLQQLIERHGALPNLVLLEMMLQVFSGLSAAHENGIFHRDIKPSNIMIDKYGSVRIMDFGIAHLVSEESITVTGTFVGSPQFISPEQAGGKKAGAGTDIFSCGSVLYLGGTGKLAFDGENPHSILFSIVHDTPTLPHLLNGKLLEVGSELAQRCLDKDTEKRPSARQAVEHIERVAQLNKLPLGRKRIADFMKNAAAYALSEDRELYELFTERARIEYKHGRQVRSLKNYSQAKAFGELTSEDKRNLTRIGRRFLFRKAAVGAVLALLVLACVYAGWEYAQKRTPKLEQEPASLRTDTLPDTLMQALDTVAQRKDSLLSAYGANGAQNSKIVAPPVPPQPVAANTIRKAAPPKPQTGYLLVKTRPANADVFVDDLARGTTRNNFTIPLPTGKHDVRVELQNFQPIETGVSIRAGDTTRIVRELVKSERR